MALVVFAAWPQPVSPSKQAAPDLSRHPWLYLRGGQPLAGSERVAEVMAVGDLTLGRGVAGEPQPLYVVAGCSPRT
jgi:hypothetical protein